jgi:hypothetical protein
VTSKIITCTAWATILNAKTEKTFRNETVCTNYQYWILKMSFELAQIKSILSVFGINYKEIFEKHGHKKRI